MNRLLKYLSLFGPGWIVMIADVDSPSVITALVSGASFGLSFIWVMLILIIPLYFVQESVARIGIATKKGFINIVKENYSKNQIKILTLIFSIINVIGFVGEFAGISFALSFFGIPIIISLLFVIIFHTILVLMGSYKKVENSLLFITLLLFSFIVISFFVKPSFKILDTILSFNSIFSYSYLSLIVANIGAVIMPWMIFYQEYAVIDKNLKREDLEIERKETLIGAIVSQILMISIIYTSTILFYPAKDFNISVSNFITVFNRAKLAIFPYLFSIGIVGAGFLSGVVISLSSAWSMADLLDFPGSLNLHVKKAKFFYGIYFIEIIPASIIILLYPKFIDVMVDSMILNTVLLPIPLYYTIKISSDKSIMGELVNSKRREYVLWIIFISINMSIIFMLLSII
jgi:Mn2+/Fe2+ NRAMP family transporter